MRVVASATFTIRNKCNYTVWPGILSNAGIAPLSTTGFALRHGESKNINLPSSWGGRFWGRTHCSEDSAGKFSCITGDCGSGKLECARGQRCTARHAGGVYPRRLRWVGLLRCEFGRRVQPSDARCAAGWNGSELYNHGMRGGPERRMPVGVEGDKQRRRERRLQRARARRSGKRSTVAAARMGHPTPASRPRTRSCSRVRVRTPIATRMTTRRAPSLVPMPTTSSPFAHRPTPAQRPTAGSSIFVFKFVQKSSEEQNPVASNSPVINGTMVYEGVLDSSGAPSRVDVFRSQAIASGVVAIMASIWRWRQLF
ncbi:pathogenesis-related thaumatin superfamily protein [Actinidia rufa]|uniref:Pathogenesis-related thaumatin superfamily protein n=1 Tax=Actinidia rufa TaxID=165716 RepID=A0A7J0FB11_9ERIC|nr:pathogenesis-related thaumatin superfamily protein [Actinidia rufa]